MARACHCERSILATCCICGEKGHISPTAGMCLVCLTGEQDEDRTAEFIMHDLKCPEAERYLK